MIRNVLPNLLFPTKGAVNPQTIAAAGNATSAWLQIVGEKWLSVRALFGALGGGTVTIDVLQAKDNVGTASKAMQSGIIVSSANNGQVVADINLDAVLDINNGFNFIQVKASNVGGTGAVVGIDIQIGPPRSL